MRILCNVLSSHVALVSQSTYEVPCLFVGMHVNVLEKRAEIVDLARKRGLLELFVGHRDVTLLSIEEAPTILVSREHRSQKDWIL